MLFSSFMMKEQILASHPDSEIVSISQFFASERSELVNCWLGAQFGTCAKTVGQEADSRWLPLLMTHLDDNAMTIMIND